MTIREAREVLGDVRSYLASRASLENEMLAGHTFTDICNAIKTLEQQPNRCDSCIHSEEQDGSNCYECVKGMADNFEAQPRDCKTCKHSDKGNCAYTEECHECMWECKYEQQPCEDCISREGVMKCFKKWQPYMATRLWDYEQELKNLPSATPQQTRWIPVKWHIKTEVEEYEQYPEGVVMLDCPMPEEGEDVLITIKGKSGQVWIEKDTALKDEDGWYTDGGYDWVDDIIAWIPLPEPYKVDNKVNADKGVLEKINEEQDSLRATCKAWDEAIKKHGYVN